MYVQRLREASPSNGSPAGVHCRQCRASEKGERGNEVADRQSPAGQQKRGNGLEEPPCKSEPFFFPARHGFKNPGFVLRPLSPYAIASLGVA